MMYQTLYQFLIFHKKLTLPGVGTFAIQRNAATADFINRSFYPQQHAFIFDNTVTNASKKLFASLASFLGINETDAIRQLNDFSFDVKNELQKGTVITWDGVGILKKNLAGTFDFTGEKNASTLLQPVIAEKVIRENASHTMRVGEDERTSEEMTALLEDDNKQKMTWWILPLGLIILSSIFLGWYFSEHGANVSASGNSQITAPQQAPATYKVLP